MATCTTSSSTTFKVFEKVKAANVKISGENGNSICSQLEAYEKNNCAKVIMESEFSLRVRASRINGFIRTVVECYNNHHNLAIRPDDIWTSILTQFSFYSNKHADEFRSQFVNFDGKEELEVEISGTLHTAPFDIFVTKMTDKIDENLVDTTVKDWILPNFSTTTANDIISCGVVFMATTKKYFDYTACCCRCGIPSVTLEGTVADWEHILNRLEKLKSYNLDKWYCMLRPILEEFVAAKNNKPNVDFWARICDVHGGSGPNYLSGWVTAFAAFDEEGNWNRSITSDGKWLYVDFDDIPSGAVTVDVKIVEIGNGKANVYQSLFFAGHIAYKVLEDDVTLKPQIGWGLALKSREKNIGKLNAIVRAMFHR